MVVDLVAVGTLDTFVIMNRVSSPHMERPLNIVCAEMMPGLRRVLVSAVPYLSVDELAHACSVLSFLRDEVSVLNLSHFGAKHGDFVVSLLDDLELVRRLSCLTFEPSPTAVKYGRSVAYLYDSWPIPSSLPRCSWDSLTRLHLHVTWWSNVIDTAMESPMAVLESLKVTLPAQDAVGLDYARCFPVLHSLMVERAYPDSNSNLLYPWNDLSQLPVTLTLLDASWAQVTSLPSGLLTARIGEMRQDSEPLTFPSSLTGLTIARARGETWREGYSRLASDHVRVTLEGVLWESLTYTSSIPNFFPANVERLIGFSNNYDVAAPSDVVSSVQPVYIFTPFEPLSVRVKEIAGRFGELVLCPGRRHVRLTIPFSRSVADSAAILAKQLDGVLTVEFIGGWTEELLTHAFIHLPRTVVHVDVISSVLTDSQGLTVWTHLPPTVTILSPGFSFGTSVCKLVESVPQTVQHLLLHGARGLVNDQKGDSRTAPLTLWVGDRPSYMYDGYGGLQKIVTQ